MKYLLSLIAAVALVLALTPGAAAQAAKTEVTLIGPGGIRAPLTDLLPKFEAKTGYKVNATFGSGGGTKQRVMNGESFDVPIVQPPTAPVIATGHVDKATESPLATVAIGGVVRKGAPKVDLSTTDAVKKTFLAAKSISYPNPESGAAAGLAMEATLKKLGIYDQVKPKIKYGRGGAGAVNMAANGEVELALTYLTEIENPNIDMTGVLPKDLLEPTGLVAFLSAHPKQPEAAKALLQFLTSPEAMETYKKFHMTPAR
jgi:molybdate transport system substrate-binding protein